MGSSARCAGDDLANGGAPVVVAARQHLQTRAGVILAVHPGDGEQVGELPEEQDGVKHPSLPTQAVADGSPADQRRHGARKRSDPGAKRRSALQRRIEDEVSSQRCQRQRAGEGIGSNPQLRSASDREQDSEPQGLTLGNRPAGRGRFAVRRIKASVRHSRYWFSVPVPLATSSVPMSVWNSSQPLTAPGAAR